MRASLLLTVPLVVGLTACGGSSDDGDSASEAGDVAIGAGDTTCEVSSTSFAPGKITFDVQNIGKDVTEVYVYAKGSDGAFDKVVGEVENVAPGTSRDFVVTVSGGDYEIACKPGQQGEGIRTPITVSDAPTGEAE